MAKAVLLALVIILPALPLTAFCVETQIDLASHVDIISSNTQGITLQFDLTDLETENIEREGEAYESLFLPGEGLTYDYGKPSLPAVTRFVIVPPQVGLELVVTHGEPRRIQADRRPILCDDDFGVDEINRDNNKDTGLYPSVVAEMSDPLVIRGVRLVKVTTYPVQYDFDTDSYLHYGDVGTEIRFTDDPPINPVEHPVRRNRSQHFLKFIRGFALNGDEVGRDDPDRDILPPYVGHYLIATHESCLEYAAPFIEWRRKSGWKVDILSLSSNDARNANEAKDQIQERYDAYLEEGIDPFDHILLIGDHADHQGCGAGQQWILGSFVGNSCWPHNCNHYDWFYACLEGRNDVHADVGLSRWCSGSASLMQVFVNRTLAYEVEPYMEETEWFTRGSVYAQRWGGTYHVSLATNVRWGKHVLESRGFDDVRVFEDMANHGDNQGVGRFLTDQFNHGVNVMMGRAENYYWRSNFNGVNENVVFPIDLCIGGHHEWTCWWMMRSATPNNLKGPVCATTGWGGPQTLPMSIVWLELVNGFMLRDQTYGWSRLQGVMAPEGYIPNFGNTYNHVKTDIMYYGDPGMQWWQGVPLVVEAEFPETITPATKLVEVYVFDPAEDIEVPGAQVTLYVPGEMPDFDEDDYADYDDMFMVTKVTDNEGIALFVFDNDMNFEPGTMNVTVTGRNILPNFGEIEMEVPEIAVSLADFELREVEGNDDEAVNPGESFQLRLTARNLSENDAARDVIAVITSLSPYAEIAGDELTFGDIAAGEEAASGNFVVLNISADCPDGVSRPVTRPALEVQFVSGEESWTTAIKLTPAAPNFEVRGVVGGNVIADSVDHVNLDLENVGSIDAPAVRARLVSNGMGVSIIEEFANYPAIEAGGHSQLEGEGYLVSGNKVVVPGSTTEMFLILTSEDSFIDTAYFELQITEPRENAPQGPDAFGYICFDDTDTEWEMAPDYNWVEISTEDDDADFEGELIDFRGQADIGEILVVDLPFETQFYGHVYDKISVATNGFIAMGEQDYVTNYQNWPMDRAIGGGVGMLAPFWDDLRMQGDAGVYYYFDEEDSRFIVEWYELRHRGGGDAILTFQVILYDSEVWITETGDQNILFQYKTISQHRGRGGDWQNHSPYASVGISSTEGNTGINYTFNNQYPVTSAPMEDGRALLFSTSPRYKSGILYGVVTDHANGRPVGGAVVFTKHGFTAYSDEDGYWRIANALAEVPFDIYCIRQGYNDSTEYDLEVPEEDSLEIGFDLLHPEFTPTVWELTAMLDPELETELGFTLTNTGNGPMDWKVERRLLGDANAPPWQYRRSFNVGQTVDDDHMEGVVFVNENFWVVGGNDNSPTIYKFDRDGALVDTFPQFELDDRRGMRDLAWDGNLIWGSLDRAIFGFNLEGELVTTFDAPFRPVTAVTYDEQLDVLWIASTTVGIIAMTRAGEEIDSLRIERNNLRIYGLGYFRDDPDEAQLYIFHRERDTNRQVVHKCNPLTGDTTFVAYLIPEMDASPGGVFITNTYDVYSWVFVALASAGRNAGGDRVDLWQVEARRDWFQLDIVRDENRVEADSGRIETGESFDFILNLNSTELPDTLFEGELLYYHNADSGRGHIYVALDVIGPTPPFPFSLASPADGDTLDTTAVALAWNPSIDPNDGEEVSYRAWVNLDQDTVDFALDDTTLSVDLLESFGFNIDEPALFNWWVAVYSDPDTVPCVTPFSFRYIPPSLLNDPFGGMPVEFGLRSIYPNPFNARVAITFGADKAERTLLRVFDITGRQVCGVV